MTLKTLLISSLLLSPLTYAQSDIMVQDAYARATPPHAPTSAVFAQLMNNSDQDRYLTAISTPVAGKAELHDVIHDGDIMQMRQLDKVALPAHQSITFKPGGMHIMLFNLKQPLVEGQTIDLNASFANGETIHFTAPVTKIMGEMSMHSMDMHHSHDMSHTE